MRRRAAHRSVGRNHDSGDEAILPKIAAAAADCIGVRLTGVLDDQRVGSRAACTEHFAMCVNRGTRHRRHRLVVFSCVGDRSCGRNEQRRLTASASPGDLSVRRNVFWCRLTLIRGRSHPTRCASVAGSLHAIRERERLVSPAALIRGRSHPTRCASGTWLAARSATWLAAHSARAAASGDRRSRRRRPARSC
jgi:hypothetical protein